MQVGIALLADALFIMLTLPHTNMHCRPIFLCIKHYVGRDENLKKMKNNLLSLNRGRVEENEISLYPQIKCRTQKLKETCHSCHVYFCHLGTRIQRIT